jgi:hypothetical protein
MIKNSVIYLSALFIFLCAPRLVYSQGSQNEIYTAYGAASIQEIASLLDDIVIIPFTAGDFEINSTFGPVIGGYQRKLSNNLTFGIEGSYNSFQKTYNIAGVKFSIKSTFITGMLHTSYVYNPSNSVQFYSGVSAGISSFTQKDDSSRSESKTILAYHVNALGIKAGKNAGAFLEIGMGWNGIINGGIFIKF